MEVKDESGSPSALWNSWGNCKDGILRGKNKRYKGIVRNTDYSGEKISKTLLERNRRKLPGRPSVEMVHPTK